MTATKSKFYFIMKGYNTNKHYAKADTKEELSQKLLDLFPSCNSEGRLMKPIYPEPMKRMRIKRV